MFVPELHAQNPSSSASISTIGWYYYEKERKVLHCQNPLLEVHKGRISRLEITASTPLKDLKKIIVILQKAGKLKIPADIMLKVQEIYGECFKSSISTHGNHAAAKMEEPLLSRIVSLMKCKGKLPKEETALFVNGRREKFLWFISAATIEREASYGASPEEGCPKTEDLYPILFCEETEAEIPSQKEAVATIMRGIRQFLARQASQEERAAD